jgi:superfamily II DNA or RNA helicase
MCIDEVHRSPCHTYTKIIDNYKGRYLIGLSATPSRSDGLTSVMKWYVGGIHVSISLDKANLCPCYYKIIVTDFVAKNCFQQKYSTALVELARNQKRNKLIIKNVLKHIKHPGVHLIISQNRMHCTKLYKLLPTHIRLISEILTGKIKEKERKKIVKRISENKLKFLFATDKLIGEGFDEDWLSVGHQTTPISDPNRLIQYLGRIRRSRSDKKYALWFDYFDAKEGVLRSGARKRVEAYQKNDIKKMEE